MNSYRLDQALSKLYLAPNQPADQALLQAVRKISPQDIEQYGAPFIAREILELYLRVLRRRANLHLGRNRLESLVFEQKTLACWISWVPGKDPDHEACAEILKELNNGNTDNVIQIITQLEERLKTQISREQRKRASTPRKKTAFNELIEKIVKEHPQITERELVKTLEVTHVDGLTINVMLHEIEIDKPETGYSETIPISSIRNRLSRTKKEILLSRAGL